MSAFAFCCCGKPPKTFYECNFRSHCCNCWPHNIDPLMKFGDMISEAALICCCALDWVKVEPTSDSRVDAKLILPHPHPEPLKLNNASECLPTLRSSAHLPCYPKAYKSLHPAQSFLGTSHLDSRATRLEVQK